MWRWQPRAGTFREVTPGGGAWRGTSLRDVGHSSVGQGGRRGVSVGRDGT